MKVKQKAIRGNAQVSGTLEIFFLPIMKIFPYGLIPIFFCYLLNFLQLLPSFVEFSTSHPQKLGSD